MMRPSAPAKAIALSLGGLLVTLLILPLLVLLVRASGEELRQGLMSPLLLPALGLSLRTSLASLAIMVFLGTPLAYWIAMSQSRWSRAVELLVDLPLVIPPAVIGVALLQTFGRRGLLGPLLESLGVDFAFSTKAVVLAQVIVSAPYFVQASANGFRKVEPDMLIVARTLGAGEGRTFFRVAVPIALPSLVVGASLAWARALGEFGATLLFAGNLPGTTQTMPLAIVSALESDVRVALVLSLLLAGLSVVLLFGLRTVPELLSAVPDALHALTGTRSVRNSQRGGDHEL